MGREYKWDQVCNRGIYEEVKMWHSPEKIRSKTERRLPRHLYISLKPMKLWNWIHGCGERHSIGNHSEGCSRSEKVVKRRMTLSPSPSLPRSLWHLPPEWHHLNRAQQPNSDSKSKRKGNREAGREAKDKKKRIERAWRTVKHFGFF